MKPRRQMPPGRPFKAGEERTREVGRRGGKSRPSRKYRGPYTGDVLDLMDIAGMTSLSWQRWRTILRAAFALGVTPAGNHLLHYRRLTAREDPPRAPVDELWICAGRRGGKSRIGALIGLHRGIAFDPSRLAPGEVGVVPIIAADRKQSRVVLRYLKAMCELPELQPYVESVLKESITLHTRVHIEVSTASYRTIRGYTLVAAILDEIGYWRDEATSTNPDSEILDALRPGLATVPGAVLVAISSPYAQRGELYRMHDAYFGADDPHILIVNADTATLNPTVPQRVIERAFDMDPSAAAAEWGADGRVQFRTDVEAFVDPAAVTAVTVAERRELPAVEGVRYVGFVDPSGGAKDSFTLAVAHTQGRDVAVLDAVRETRPPFSPDSVVAEYALLLHSYRISSVTGDRYAGEWPREAFRNHGIAYTPSEKAKSDIYRELLAPLNSARIELLDLPSLRAQLCALERKVARGGRDSIDHPAGAHDDLVNAAAGALVFALPSARSFGVKVCRFA